MDDDPGLPVRVLEGMVEAVVVVDTRHRTIYYANAAANALLGLKTGEATAGTVLEDTEGLCGEDASPLAPAHHPLRRAREEGRDVEGELVGMTRPGGADTLWMRVNAYARHDAQGAVRRIAATFLDITRHTRMEAELESHRRRLEHEVAALKTARDAAEPANRARSEFLSRMSHELRTPLNAVLGFAQLLVSDTTEPLTPNQADNVREILEAGGRLLEMINGVTDLSPVEDGGPELQVRTETVDMVPPVETRGDHIGAHGTPGRPPLPGSAGSVSGESSPGTQRRCRVLYIEDDAVNVGLLKLLAVPAGLDLLTAGDAERGLVMARREEPEVILLDINLPGMGGREAVGLLKADPATHHIPVIAVSGEGREEGDLTAGFDAWLMKPFEVERLRDLIRRVMRDARGSS